MCHVLNSYSNFYFRFPMSQDGRRGFQRMSVEEIDAIRDKKIRAIQVSEITFWFPFMPLTLIPSQFMPSFSHRCLSFCRLLPLTTSTTPQALWRAGNPAPCLDPKSMWTKFIVDCWWFNYPKPIWAQLHMYHFIFKIQIIFVTTSWGLLISNSTVRLTTSSGW